VWRLPSPVANRILNRISWLCPPLPAGRFLLLPARGGDAAGAEVGRVLSLPVPPAAPVTDAASILHRQGRGQGDGETGRQGGAWGVEG